MIATYILTCFCASLCVVATWRLFNDDTSFMSHLRYLLYELPAWIKKPLYDCMFCMSSLWGVSFFILFNNLFDLHFGILKALFAVFVIAGIVSLLQGAMMIMDWLLTLVKMLEKPEEIRDTCSEEVIK